MAGNWDALHQNRQRGECSICHYAPRNERGESIRTGRHCVASLRLIYMAEEGVLVGKFVSLYGGIEGANGLLDELLGDRVAAMPKAPSPTNYSLPSRAPGLTSSAPWPFSAA